MSSICLLSVENFSLLGLPQVPKNKFNWRSEKMQKKKKRGGGGEGIVKKDKMIIV